MLVLLMLRVSGAAAEPDARAVQDAFAKRQAATRSLRAEVTQTLQPGGLPEPVISRLTLRYAAPDRLALDYSEPAGDGVRLAGATMWIGHRGRWTKRSMDSDPAAQPVRALMALMRGERPAVAADYVDTLTAAPGRWLVRLMPVKAPGPRAPRRIDLQLDRTTLGLESVEIALPGEGFVRYEFRAVSRDVPVPDASFSPPTQAGTN